MTSYLVTGGTGALGQALVQRLLDDGAERVAVFSRDEHKQQRMAEAFGQTGLATSDRLRFFLGDVRDRERLSRACVGVDAVIHAAALKVVPSLEYNPGEAVKTNVYGAQNVIEAALDRGVRRVVAISSDKACEPLNIYGASKLCAEKLITAAQEYGGNATTFSALRYGNVTGSTGSVVPAWAALAAKGFPLPITDPAMTRFWITLHDAVDLVIYALKHAEGGEVFVPKLPAYSVLDLAQALAPGHATVITGIRPGEKLHESLIGEHEVPFARDLGEHYALLRPGAERGEPLRAGFRYRSDAGPQLSILELRARLGMVKAAVA